MRIPLAIAVSLCIGLSLVSLPAAAAERLKPEDAADQRASIESGLSTDPRLAIQQLTLEAERSGDPELFLLGARRALTQAKDNRDTEAAATAETLALTARDIGAYLSDGDNYGATQWHPVNSERAGPLSAEAALLATEAGALIDEIEAEKAAAAAEAERLRLAALEEDDRKRKPLPPGTGLIAGGSAALVIGVGGLGMMGAGFGLGASAQREVESLLLPQDLDRVAELDQKGSTANVLAYVGGAVGAVGIAVGATLVALGIKKRKAGGGSAAEDSALSRLHVGGWALRESAGLTLGGSF